MTQRGVLWEWVKVRAWERESVFNSCPTHSHPHVMPLPPCHLSCWQMKWPCSLTSQRFVLLHKISAVTSDSLLVLLTSWRCILSRYASFFTGQDTWSEISWNASCAFLSRISALPNFLRSHCVQMFHIPAWMLLFFVHPHEIHFWRVISRSPCLTITMGYCYSCLLYNFHPRIPNNQYFKLLDVQNTFKTQLQACVWTLKSNLLEQNVDLSLPSISSNAWDCSKFVDLSLLP